LLVGSQSIRASEQRGLFFFPFSGFYFGNPAFTIGIGDDQVGIGGQLFIAAPDNAANRSRDGPDKLGTFQGS